MAVRGSEAVDQHHPICQSAMAWAADSSGLTAASKERGTAKVRSCLRINTRMSSGTHPQVPHAEPRRFLPFQRGEGLFQALQWRFGAVSTACAPVAPGQTQTARYLYATFSQAVYCALISSAPLNSRTKECGQPTPPPAC